MVFLNHYFCRSVNTSPRVLDRESLFSHIEESIQCFCVFDAVTIYTIFSHYPFPFSLQPSSGRIGKTLCKIELVFQVTSKFKFLKLQHKVCSLYMYCLRYTWKVISFDFLDYAAHTHIRKLIFLTAVDPTGRMSCHSQVVRNIESLQYQYLNNFQCQQIKATYGSEKVVGKRKNPQSAILPTKLCESFSSFQGHTYT